MSCLHSSDPIDRRAGDHDRGRPEQPSGPSFEATRGNSSSTLSDGCGDRDSAVEDLAEVRECSYPYVEWLERAKRFPYVEGSVARMRAGLSGVLSPRPRRSCRVPSTARHEVARRPSPIVVGKPNRGVVAKAAVTMCGRSTRCATGPRSETVPRGRSAPAVYVRKAVP